MGEGKIMDENARDILYKKPVNLWPFVVRWFKLLLGAFVAGAIIGAFVAGAMDAINSAL